jgi:hypothetical protein
MSGIVFNLVSLVATLAIVRLASGSWYLTIPFAAFWSLGLAISIIQWWQWERRLPLRLRKF